MYLDGTFHELKDRNRYQPMKKDPLKQASDAMYGFSGQVYAGCVSPEDWWAQDNVAFVLTK